MASGDAAPYYGLREQTYTNGHAYGASEEAYNLSNPMAPAAPMYVEAGQSHSLAGTYNSQSGSHDLTDATAGTHMAQLLQAANSVVEQDQVAQSSVAATANERRSATQSNNVGALAPGENALGSASQQNRGKRRRGSGALENEGHDTDNSQPAHEATIPRGTKRSKRISGDSIDLHDPALTEPSHGDKPSPRKSAANSGFPQMYPNALTDARAAGVHSAAALFRRPSNNPVKKYTRPPMSKLFLSLQLSPENFLHLQAAAKNYMLDPEHPDRQNCVGNRGKGDTDMVKLKLFNCVRQFLEDDVGERFFGANVPPPTPVETGDAAAALGEAEAPPLRQWVWPRDATKIITLVTPLLRRMVTNERQRQYAIETRKGGAGKKKTGDSGAPPTPENGEDVEVEYHCQGPYDPSLSEAHRPHQMQQHESPYSGTHQNYYQSSGDHFENIMTIVVVKDGRSVCPSVNVHSLSSYHTISLAEVQEIVQDMVAEANRPPAQASVVDQHAVMETRNPEELANMRAAAEQALEVASDNAAAALTLDEEPDESQQPPQAEQSTHVEHSTAGASPVIQENNEPDSRGVASSTASELETQQQQEQHPHHHHQQSTDPPEKPSFIFRVLSLTGLVTVATEEEFAAVKLDVSREVALEGCVRLIAEQL